MNVTQLYTFFNTPKSSNPLLEQIYQHEFIPSFIARYGRNWTNDKKKIYYFKLKENTTNVNSRRCCGCCDCWRGAENGTGARTGRRAGEEVSIIAQAKTKNSANQQDPKLWEIEWKKKKRSTLLILTSCFCFRLEHRVLRIRIFARTR